jgi:hypothetical protein
MVFVYLTTGRQIMNAEKITWLSDTDSLVHVKPSGNNIFVANCVKDNYDTEKYTGTTVLLYGLPFEVARAIEEDTTSFLGECATLDPSKPGVVNFKGCSVLLDIGQVAPREVANNTVIEYTPYTGE